MVTRRVLTFDDRGVSERYVTSGPPPAEEEGRSFSWDQVVFVGLMAVDPDDRWFWMPRAIWQIATLTDQGFFVVESDARRGRMLALMAEHLPGFSRDAALREARRRDVRSGILWMRPRVECPTCGTGVLAERRSPRGGLTILALECPLCSASFEVERRFADGGSADT